jgi:hypothetical protein
MKKTLAITLSTVLSIVSTINKPAEAYSNTKIVAMTYCSQYQKTAVLNPEYAGQTRNGLDLWVCFETGSMSNVFASVDPGPYAVLTCNIAQCALVDWTY